MSATLRRFVIAAGACLGVLMLSPASADEVTVPKATNSAASWPTRGMSMGKVVAEFGEPTTKHGTVGGGSPEQPPITRWDYPNFTVVFERDKVIDAVNPDASPQIQDPNGDWHSAK